MVFYPWVVIAHVVFVILAFGAHGVSAFAMFRVKRETDRARIGAVLDLSTTALVAAGIGLHPGGRAGDHRGRDGRLLRAAVAVGLDRRRRRGLDRDDADGRQPDDRRPTRARPAESRLDKKGEAPPPPATDAELAAAQAKLQPDAVAGIGHRRHRPPRLADGDEAVLTRRFGVVLVAAGLAAVIVACGAGTTSPAVGLAGTSWVVTEVGDDDTDEPRPTMTFAADGTVSGTSGCNQYSGSYEVDGGKLTITAMAATAMACADPVIDAQAADFSAALNGAASWAIRPDGDLEILAPTAILAVKGTPGIVATPAGP